MTELATMQLSHDQARALTDEVKRDADALWAKLLSLYEGGAHLALGYGSWGEYFEDEFGGSSSQAYRLLDSGRVLRALTLHSPMGERPNERQARELVPLLDNPKSLCEAWEETLDQTEDLPTAQAVREVVQRRLPGPKTAEKQARETGKAVLGTDGVWHTGKPPVDTRWQAIREWAEEIKRHMPPASQVVVPPYANGIDEAAEQVRRYVTEFLDSRRST